MTKDYGRLGSADRATDAPHEAPAGLRPDGSVSTGALGWAIAADVPDYEHLQPGKPYALVEDRGARAFEIQDERGVQIYCLWEGCAFLDGGSWRRVRAASGIEGRQAGDAKQGSTEGESPVGEAETPNPSSPETPQ